MELLVFIGILYLELYKRPSWTNPWVIQEGAQAPLPSLFIISLNTSVVLLWYFYMYYISSAEQFYRVWLYAHWILSMLIIDHQSYKDWMANTGVFMYLAIYYAIIHLYGVLG